MISMSFNFLMGDVTEKTKEIYALFQPVEGLNTVYYGKVRNGKSYAATCDIFELLRQGEVVLANWDIDFSHYDQREDFKVVALKYIVGKDIFYRFTAQNFVYIDTEDPDLIKKMNLIVGAHLFIDEGQWIFNSHLKTDDVEKRKLILEGGHYCRTLNVITQRPQNILKDIRSQVNIWYKCEKALQFGSFILFRRWEFQDLTTDDLPDEELPESRPKHYWGRASIFNAYNTHGRRSKDAKVAVPEFEVYKLGFFEHTALLLKHLWPWGKAKKEAQRSETLSVAAVEGGDR